MKGGDATMSSKEGRKKRPGGEGKGEGFGGCGNQGKKGGLNLNSLSNGNSPGNQTQGKEGGGGF